MAAAPPRRRWTFIAALFMFPLMTADNTSAAKTDMPPETCSPAPPTGIAVVQQHLKTLGPSPGVYRMLDKDGRVIYVGKARNLRARVASYSRLSGHSNRIARMIVSIASMEFVTTRTESEALLLEANLIKRFRPHYNVLLRDDKSFPYIVITRDHEAAMLGKHRGARNRKGDYFGPFASAGAVNRTINTLQRAFLLRNCSNSVYESRSRPCLQYQIKRCSAPCTGEISIADYNLLVDEAYRFLRGESQEVRTRLQDVMQAAADELNFEKAAEYRDRLAALSHISADQNINPAGIEEADVFASTQQGGQTSIQVFFFRTGQNWGNRAYFPRADRALGNEEVLEAFIAQFYDDKPVPRLILLSHDLPGRHLLAEALSSKADRKVRITVPQRGAKRALVDHASANACEALQRRLAESATQHRLLHGLKERFDLATTPRRIEVYDNSHISGTNAVGAMIVAGPEGLVKNQYRKFNIKSDDIKPGDDYAMMREVLTRRFRRLVKDHGADGELAALQAAARQTATRSGPAAAADSSAAAAAGSSDAAAGSSDSTANSSDAAAGSSDSAANSSDAATGSDSTSMDTPPWPDLVLIDGGRGQLSVVQQVLADLEITGVTLIGVAKGPDRDAGREHFHRPGQARPVMLEPRDPVLYFVQRLRDEAHRFAIGSHRQKRAKAMNANPLDDITGIGPTRKRALLQYFGSAKAVSRAGVEDLKAIPTISAQMAQMIYDFFHDGSA